MLDGGGPFVFVGVWLLGVEDGEGVEGDGYEGGGGHVGVEEDEPDGFWDVGEGCECVGVCFSSVVFAVFPGLVYVDGSGGEEEGGEEGGEGCLEGWVGVPEEEEGGEGGGEEGEEG